MPRSSSCSRCAALAFAGLGTLAHAQTATFRMTDLDLRDPHLFAQILTCSDVTDTTFAGYSFNKSLQDSIQGDAEPDGYLDRSYLVQFLPLAQSQATNLIDVGTAQCTAPMEGTTCGGIAGTNLSGDATLLASGTCLEPVPGTTGAYSPAISVPAAQCFVSQQGDVTIDFAGIPLTLRKARIAASFTGDPATGLANGLLSGFLTEADANNTIIPNSYPFFGGQPLSKLLRGGTGVCASGSDKDLDGETPGWWFYFNFPAARVTEPPNEVFSNGFE